MTQIMQGKTESVRLCYSAKSVVPKVLCQLINRVKSSGVRMKPLPLHRRWECSAALLALLSMPAPAECIDQSPGDAHQQFEFQLPEDKLTPHIPDEAYINRIEVRRFNIFDLDNPRDNRWYGRLANRLHWVTREREVRHLLLFKEGDPWKPQRIAESERLLRRESYLYDARVRPLRLCGNAVDLLVLVRDVWTISGGASFSRSGGENKSELFISDSNLLGTGTTLSLGRDKDAERSGSFFEFSDRTLQGSRWQLNSRYADNDDGFDYLLALQKPFFSLDSRSSIGFEVRQTDQDTSLYYHDDKFETFQQDTDSASLSLGWSRGLHKGRARRWELGWQYTQDRFSPAADTRDPLALPHDRTRAFPWLGYSSVEDEFRVARNINDLQRSEDIYVGERWGLRLGLAGTAVGSDESQIYASAYYHNTARDTEQQLLFVELEGEGFWDQGDNDWENLVISHRWRWFVNPYRRSQWLLEARLDYTRNLTRDNQLLLGGSTGLRGYPSRFQTGDRAFLFSLEKRYHYDIHLWRLFYIGSAAFFDIGRAWFPDRNDYPDVEDRGDDDDVLTNIGIGLRITSSRFRSDQVLHIDLAFPLERGENIDDVQLVLRGRQRF